jgi:hypothetical protein
MLTQHQKHEQNRYKYWLSQERKKNKQHKIAKKAQGWKPRSIWGQTCPFMCMLSDRPKVINNEPDDERMIRIMDRQVHRLTVYNK